MIPYDSMEVRCFFCTPAHLTKIGIQNTTHLYIKFKGWKTLSGNGRKEQFCGHRNFLAFLGHKTGSIADVKGC